MAYFITVYVRYDKGNILESTTKLSMSIKRN